MKSTLLLAALFSMACLSTARSAVLVAWDPQGITSDWPENWSSSSQGGTVTVDSGIDLVAGLGRGAGTSLAGLNNGWGLGAVNQTTQAGALADGDYLNFTLAPQEGFAMSLASLDFNVRLPTSGWDAGASRYQWQYKVGDGSFVDIGSPLALVGDYNTNGAAQPTLDLSGVAGLQNVTDAVELRMYAWGTGGQFVFGRLAGNDLALSGSVAAVPEPSRLLLAGFGALGFLLQRRRMPRAV